MHRMDEFPRHMLSGMSYHHLHYLLHHRFLFQVSANYIVSQFAVWAIDFPGGTDNSNVKWRALIWVISEVFVLISVSINYLPPRMYSLVSRISFPILMLDFFLCVIWLPFGVSKTYGFRSAKEVFTTTCNASIITRYSYFTNKL